MSCFDLDRVAIGRYTAPEPLALAAMRPVNGADLSFGAARLFIEDYGVDQDVKEAAHKILFRKMREIENVREGRVLRPDGFESRPNPLRVFREFSSASMTREYVEFNKSFRVFVSVVPMDTPMSECGPYTNTDTREEWFFIREDAQISANGIPYWPHDGRFMILHAYYGAGLVTRLKRSKLGWIVPEDTIDFGRFKKGTFTESKYVWRLTPERLASRLGSNGQVAVSPCSYYGDP